MSTLSILKQNILKYKEELVLFLIILILIPIIILFNIEKKEENFLPLQMQGKDIQLKISEISKIYSNDIFINYDLSSDLSSTCMENNYDCFMTIWVYEPLIQDYRQIGPITNLKNSEENETFIPNDLIDAYSIDISELKVKIKVEVFLDNESQTFESQEYDFPNQ